MAKPKYTKAQAVEGADEVREMTLAEMRALPGLLGPIAGARAAVDGFYGFRDTSTGRKILLVVR
jgi:hypothetical protein